MKRTLIYFFALSALIISNVAFASSQKDSNPFTEEVSIKSNTGALYPDMERSGFPVCQVFLSGRNIDVLFNKCIGEAYVMVVNQNGIVVSTQTCNSEFEPSTLLLKPTVKGIYRIYIIGSTGYQGEGDFSIE